MLKVNNSYRQRPLGLSILCMIAFVYYGLLTLVFLSGLIFSTGINDIINTYIQQYELSRSRLLLINLVASFLFGISFWGIYKLWILKRGGFYILLTSSTLLIISQLVQGAINWFYLIVAVIFILLFGIYFKRLKFKKT